MSTNQGYAAEAPDLLRRYEAMVFTEAHAAVLDVLPRTPARVLDIGAGTGRDAAYFVAHGHRVLAVEPTFEMRVGAMALHPSPAIEWLDDALPDLPAVIAHGETFDLVWLSAVWMHLDAAQRTRAMAVIDGLIAANGQLMITLRHGPVPPGRRMFEVTSDETIALAAEARLRCALHSDHASAHQTGVSWTTLYFERA